MGSAVTSDVGKDAAQEIEGVADDLGQDVDEQVGPAGRLWRGVRGLDRRRKALIAVLVVLVVLVVAACGGAWWRLQGDDLPAGAAFRVGDTTVSGSAVQARVKTLKALYGVTVPTDKAKHATFEQDAAKSMAVQIILQDEADRMHLSVPGKDVDSTLNALITQRYPDGGRTAFVAALGQLGANVDQVRDEISNQILVSKIFDQVVKGISVTDAQVKAAYVERRTQLGTPAKRDLLNIVVADKKTAQQVLRRLTAGASFASLAARYSLDGSTRKKGGDLGEVSAAELESGYAKVAFATRVGGTFGPVKTEHGWNVGEVTRSVPAVPAVYAKVKASLKKTLLAEQSVAKWRAWLADVIKAHHVVYSATYRPAHPDAVPDVDQTTVENSSGE